MGAKTYLLMVVALALAMELAFIATNHVTFAIDEYTYMDAAKAFASGDYAHSPEIARFPLYPFVVSLAGPNANFEVASRLINLIIAGIGVGLAYLLARELAGNKAGLYAALLTASNPVLLFLAGKTLTEPLFTALMLLFVLFVVKSRDHAWMLIPAGIAASLAIQARYTGIVLIPLAAILMVKEWRLKENLPYIIAGAVAFVAFLAPMLWFNYQYTGDPVGLVRQFFSSQVKVDASYFGLPDKIPSHILGAWVPSNIFTLLFLLGAASPFLIATLWAYKTRLLSKGVFEPLLFAVGFAAVLDAYALLNFALLRYVAVVAPLLTVVAGQWLADKEGKNFFGKSMAQWAFLLCIANIAIAAGALGYFNLYYAKHVDYRDAGLYMAANCTSVFTDVPSVAGHYVNGTVSAYTKDFHEPPDCIADSSYDAWNERGAFANSSTAYAEVYSHGQVMVSKRMTAA